MVNWKGIDRGAILSTAFALDIPTPKFDEEKGIIRFLKREREGLDSSEAVFKVGDDGRLSLEVSRKSIKTFDSLTYIEPFRDFNYDQTEVSEILSKLIGLPSLQIRESRDDKGGMDYYGTPAAFRTITCEAFISSKANFLRIVQADRITKPFLESIYEAVRKKVQGFRISQLESDSFYIDDKFFWEFIDKTLFNCLTQYLLNNPEVNDRLIDFNVLVSKDGEEITPYIKVRKGPFGIKTLQRLGPIKLPKPLPRLALESIELLERGNKINIPLAPPGISFDFFFYPWEEPSPIRALKESLAGRLHEWRKEKFGPKRESKAPPIKDEAYFLNLIGIDPKAYKEASLSERKSMVRKRIRELFIEFHPDKYLDSEQKFHATEFAKELGEAKTFFEEQIGKQPPSNN